MVTDSGVDGAFVDGSMDVSLDVGSGVVGSGVGVWELGASVFVGSIVVLFEVNSGVDGSGVGV